MCVRKLRILNPAYNPHDILSNKFIEVNCGHCWQCKLERSNGFSFRVLHEVLRDGVVPFFVTLTYNDKYLPKLFYIDEKRELRSISCWNRQHVQRFHKRLRRYIHYYYGLPSSVFKYLCTCERGGSQEYISDSGRLRVATERPHYHPLYILSVDSACTPVRPLPSDYFDYCRVNRLANNFVSFFRFLLNREWFYGNVDDVAFCRDIVTATKYVTKYITKNESEKVCSIRPDSIYRFVDFDLADRLDKYSSGLSSCRFDTSLDSVLGISVPVKIGKLPPSVSLSDLFPRSFSSVNLGASWLDGKSESDLYSYFSGIKKVVLPSADNSSLINLPSYYFSKFCKRVKRLHFNRYYSRNILENKSYVCGCVYTRKKFIAKHSWNTLDGFHLRFNPSVYSVLETTDFGKRMQRFRAYRQIKQICIDIKNYLFNSLFYDTLYLKYKKFSSDVKSCVHDVVHEHLIEHFKNVSVNKLFGRVLSLRKISIDDMDYLDYPDLVLFNLINYIKVCRFAASHLKHVDFENQYHKKLVSTAFNNPDLFLSHYL